MPDKALEELEAISRSEDDYHEFPDILPPVREPPSHRATLTRLRDIRYYGGMRSMDSYDRDRPISYSSTSSSASSRDSRSSLSSGMTLVSNSHLGLAGQEKEAGAIRLELIPTRQLSGEEPHGRSKSGCANSGEVAEKRLAVGGIKRVDSRATHRNRATSPGAASGSPKLLYVDRVVQEILETERTYVQDLQSIVKDYLDCITDQTRLPLGTDDRLALFGNIRDIYHFNSELLRDLESCDSDPVAIAECFVAKSEEFHIYTQYCTNYPRSVAVLTECMRNKVLAKFFRERQETLKHSLPLGSYLLKPVQRILKYHLLLHEIVSHLEKDTECYDVVQDAIDTMQRVAWHINDMKRKHEHAVRLQEIQSLLTNWKGPDLTSYGELVLEGTFRFQRAKNERTLFLLDKLLLITKKREETYAYKAHILCCNLMLVEVIPKDSLGFSVFHYKNPKVQHTVQAKSMQDKRLWILHLKRLILENHPAKIPAKAKQAILEMDAIHHPGFHYSPEGERRADVEDRITPRRVRRKSEPSARMKTPKQAEARQDKRASVEGSLLSPSVEALSNETTPDSKSKINAFSRGDTVSQSQESLEPAYPSDLEESLHLRTLDQTDADDEEEIEQIASKSPAKESRQFSVHSVRQGAKPASLAVGWDDYATPVADSERLRTERARPSAGRVSFPGPALPRRNGDYQVFVPAASAPELHSTVVSPLHGAAGYRHPVRERPPGGPDHGIVRRASSAGESRSSCRAGSDGGRPSVGLHRAERSETPAGEQATGGAQPLRAPEQQDRGQADTGIQGLPTAAASPKRELPALECADGRLAPSEKAFKKPKNDWEACGDWDSFPGLGMSLDGGFASEESLQCSGDDTSERSRSPAKGGPAWTGSSSNSNSASRESVPDKLSEEVDEIWNDLEDYIRRSEETRRDRLPAAFPVSQDDLGALGGRRPRPAASSGPESPGLAEAENSRRGRLSTASTGTDGGEPSGEASPLSASAATFADCEGLEADSPLGSTEAVGQELDLVDRTKRRVYYMARQYSQKIKKANQLLKMKNAGEQSPSDQPKRKCKDLAAILEEKRQGGTAIGARIAEYSQLYDQLMFRETPPRSSASTDSEVWSRGSPQGLLSACSSHGRSLDAEDWLLHSTYSNGELADFVAWPDIQELAAKYSSPAAGARLQAQGRLAGSSPSVAADRPPEQRWSTLVTPPNGTGGPTLGRKEGGARGVSLSSPSVAADCGGEAGQPELTLRDPQRVVLVGGTPALDARSATRNYLANFNDTGEDDEDYVEIRSEDEDYEELDEGSLAADTVLPAGGTALEPGLHPPGGTSCTPPADSSASVPGSLAALAEPDQLSHYLWREPSPGQQNIVQTLRDKFQCLSSSSFA
ncbi:pleckstrin homology domain-containing family G member 1 isoform X2 [Pristis pectinata]|uniref:pleckstrin homology domain-containing family G member 1 isoform X2 n=1 Tax=Pristis pectinata TaxID=685728 RepID=UPI00223D2D56|nr:pleckstrin homology domain-containing family G member 1 isoform X2 [Pristis pectinata]XP_051868307.1 pleckstrin homology domain-containing family G member 1 isoform X2 [Pristis pectinata]